MKRLIIILFFIPILAKSQVYFSPALGANENLHFTIQLSLQFEIKNLVAGINGICVMHSTEAAYGNAYVGYNIKFGQYYFTPAINYGRKEFSTDNKLHNWWKTGYQFEAGKMIIEDRYLFIRYNYLKQSQLLIGAKIKL